MRILKTILFILYVTVLIMVPLGLILDKLLSFLGHVTLLITSIFSLIRLSIERKNKTKIQKSNKQPSKMPIRVDSGGWKLVPLFFMITLIF